MKPTLSDISQLLKQNKETNRDSMFYAKVNSLITSGGEVVGYKVSLDGSSNDTIEAKKIAGAKVGDTVQVTLHEGKASVTGCVGGDSDAKDAQETADAADSKAEVADGKAVAADNKATQAQQTANTANQTATSAYQKAEGVENHFWYDSDGAHVALAKPIESTTLNTLINAGGMAIRKGTTELAKFTDTLIELGKNSVNSIIEFCNGKLKISRYNSGSKISNGSAYVSLSDSGIAEIGSSDADLFVSGGAVWVNGDIAVVDGVIYGYDSEDHEQVPLRANSGITINGNSVLTNALGSGRIMDWGTVSITLNNATKVSANFEFTQPFSDTPYIFVQPATNIKCYAVVGNSSATGATIYAWAESSTATVYVRWLAVGLA